MRTIIDLPQELVDELATIGAKEDKSRAALIREAVAEYVVKKRPSDISAAFGIWIDRQIDALEYEQALRAEWED